MAARLVDEPAEVEAMRQRLQQCVSASAWSDDEFRARLARKVEAELPSVEALVVDDFGLEVLNAAQRRDLLEVLEDRYDLSSTIVASQLEPKQWHAVIGDETIADAICDRLVHNAHRIKLGGESIRKTRGDLTK